MKVEFTRDVSKNSYNYYNRHSSVGTNSLLYNINSLGFEELGKNYYLKRSEFYANMLTYIRKGTGHFFFNDHHYFLKEGDIILINGVNEHIMYPNEEGMTIYYFHIDNYSLNDFAISNERRYGCITNMKDEPKIINTIIDMVENYKDFDAFSLSHAMYKVLTAIGKKSHIENDVFTSGPLTIVKTSLYIKQNYHKVHLSLDEIADAVGFNKFYLVKEFKKHTEYTLHSYLNYVRAINARLLILETDESIEKIATLSGFYDSQSLIRYFKLYFKETPLQFRKNRIPQ